MAILGFELEEIARLLALVDANDLEEMVLEEDSRLLRIRGASYSPKKRRIVSADAPASAPAPLTVRPLPKPSAGALPAPPKPPEGTPLLSPMVGTFYRSNQPGAPPLVEVGQRVAAGEAIGLIEAMKVFSEVPCEVSGVVVAFPAADGKMVQAGDPIVIIKQD